LIRLKHYLTQNKFSTYFIPILGLLSNFTKVVSHCYKFSYQANETRV